MQRKKICFIKFKKKGQSLVESMVVVSLVSMVFFFIVEIVLALHAEQIQRWAAFAGARSRVVGFNDKVVQKAWLIGNILNSGAMLSPSQGLTESQQVSIEESNIPIFVRTDEMAGELSSVLNYKGWDDLPGLTPYSISDQYTATVSKDYPLGIIKVTPILFGFLKKDKVVLKSEVTLENHFPLYLAID